MKTRVRIKFDNVLSYPFFRAVGKPLPSSVKAIGNWTDALNACSEAHKWENCRLMARNALQGLLEERCWERTEDWNPLADELRPLIVAFCDRELPQKVASAEIVRKIKDDVAWDIMAICLEEEFKDVVEPFFYIPLLDPWYAAGHFPCGWDGEEFPDDWDGIIREGKLMVF